MPRILLLHASIGMGHQRAAQALAETFRRTPGVSVTVRDTLDFTRPFFRHSYAGSYLQLADRAPSLWSFYYAQTNHPPSPHNLFAGLRALSTSAGVNGLPALLERERPDAIVCTHYLPVEALALMRGPLPPISLVLTDYHAHQFWAVDGADLYFVPTQETRTQLAAGGIPSGKIVVSGIPIRDANNAASDRLAARRALNIPAWQHVVSLIGSGLSAERVRAMACALMVQRTPATLLIATGRNRALATDLGDLERDANGAVRVIGQLPSLDPIYAASDLVIGKAGGLTVSEVLARGVPMLIPTPVPGQERWNMAHVVDAGAGLACDSPRAVAHAATELLIDTARRTAMANAAQAVGQPNAAQAIVNAVLTDVALFQMPKSHASAGSKAWAT